MMTRSSSNQFGYRGCIILNHERSVDDDTDIIGGDRFNDELGDTCEDEY